MSLEFRPTSEDRNAGKPLSGCELQGVEFKIPDRYKVYHTDKLQTPIEWLVRKPPCSLDQYHYSFKLEENVLSRIDMNSLMESDT